MKKIFLSIFILVMLGMQSCDKKNSPGDNYDFINSLPPYVALSSTAAKTVAQGNSLTFTFQVRTALQQNVTVTYDVVGDGINLVDQTAIIERDKSNVVATVDIPNNVIVSPATTATAQLTLKKAVTADGQELTIGSKNNPATQKVTINITL